MTSPPASICTAEQMQVSQSTSCNCHSHLQRAVGSTEWSQALSLSSMHHGQFPSAWICTQTPAGCAKSLAVTAGGPTQTAGHAGAGAMGYRHKPSTPGGQQQGRVQAVQAAAAELQTRHDRPSLQYPSLQVKLAGWGSRQWPGRIEGRKCAGAGAD